MRLDDGARHVEELAPDVGRGPFTTSPSGRSCGSRSTTGVRRHARVPHHAAHLVERTDSSSATICASSMGPLAVLDGAGDHVDAPSLLSLTKPNDAVGVSVDLGCRRVRPRRAPDGAVRSRAAALAMAAATRSRHSPTPTGACARPSRSRHPRRGCSCAGAQAGSCGARAPPGRSAARPPTTPAGCRGRGSRRRAADGADEVAVYARVGDR